MKRILQITYALLCVLSCSGGTIADRAERLVWSHYKDCNSIIMVKVDTITLGDNLQFRIEQHAQGVKDRENEVEMYNRRIREFRLSKPEAAMYRNMLHKADSSLSVAKMKLRDLDSLRIATLDIANTPAAYQVCVAYNNPSNLVWIQLDANGFLIKMSKNRLDMLYNPGSDMPGYFEILDKYR